MRDLQYVERWQLRAKHIEESKVKIFHLLKSAGADLNAKTELGETPMMTSIISHYDMMFKLLISEGANVDCSFSPGRAPLFSHSMLEVALAAGNLDVIHILFDAGVDDTILSHSGLNIFTHNGDTTSWDLVQRLNSERPRKLKILCRKVIRTVLGSNIQRDISGTTLPEQLQDYVLMSDQLNIHT